MINACGVTRITIAAIGAMRPTANVNSISKLLVATAKTRTNSINAPPILASVSREWLVVMAQSNVRMVKMKLTVRAALATNSSARIQSA